MTNILKNCSHSKFTLFCEMCNKKEDFDQITKSTYDSLIGIYLDDKLGFGPSKDKKVAFKDKKEDQDDDKSNTDKKGKSTESSFKSSIDSFKLYAEIIDSIPQDNLTDESLDLLLGKELSKRNITLDVSDYFMLKQVAIQKLKKKDKSQKTKLYIDWIKLTSPKFKETVRKSYKESLIPLYNLSKLMSETLGELTDTRKRIVLNSNIDFNKLNLNIHPIIVALYFVKYQGLDYQTVYGLPQRLLYNLLNGNLNFSSSNNGSHNDFHLVFNKLSMGESLPINSVEEFEKLEEEKLIFSDACRGDILNCRTGNFAARTLTASLCESNTDEYIEYFIKMLDIYTLLYNNKHCSYVKIRIESVSGFRNPTDVLNTNFREQFNGNVIELISTTDGVGAFPLQHTNDKLFNNGFVMYKVDRSKGLGHGFLMPQSLFSMWGGDDIKDPNLYIDTTPISMPMEMKISPTKSTYKLKAVVGYCERNGRKYPGLYYTVIFTPTGDMFYYSNDFLLFSDELPAFLVGSDKQKPAGPQQYFEVADFFVKQDLKQDVISCIQGTGFLYIYDSKGHEYHLFHTQS